MRITLQFLRSRAKGPLQATEYLDLSNSEIVAIEKLNSCHKLKTLNLRGNKIYEICNLENCQQLWNLDISNNQIKSLDGLARYIALGTLNLANNDLSWHELGKIRNMHILNLYLHGNSYLEKDPYYRLHVIDCLPNVWMLDGRIITSAERLQVKHFFQDSALTDRPIRHKLSKEWFIPTTLKKIEVHGIFGEKATHVMTRFPANGAHNIETDRRRLKYLAYDLQEELILNKKYTKKEYQVLKYRRSFLEDILEARPNDRERCNMLLLLLVASLEFVMPTHLVKETLDIAKLSRVGKVYTMDLFLLPRDIRCLIVCILLGAVKIDKDDREDGGLYDRLYLCLFYTIAELTKLSNSSNTRQSAIKLRLNTLYHDYKCLLASEVVQLLCIVPAFFEYVAKDVGIMNLVITATGDSSITDSLARVAAINEGGEIKKLYEELSEMLLLKVQEQSLNINNKSRNMSMQDEILSSMKALPMKSPLNPVDVADYHSKGMTSPDREPPRVLSAKKAAERNKKRFPHLGDLLLLGPQTLGKIVSLPQPFVALVEMDSVPVANGAMVSKLNKNDDHYTYVNMDQLGWDQDLGFWKPRGAIGDSMLMEFIASNKLPNRLTMHTVEDLQKELERKANVADRTARPNSPDWVLSATGTDPKAPLLYSPRHPPTTPLELHKQKSNQGNPRPMSSLLKENFDLKLDLSRRVKSAGGNLETVPKLSSPDFRLLPVKSDSPRMAVSSQKLEETTKENVDPSLSIDHECPQCAMERAMVKGQGEGVPDHTQHVHSAVEPLSSRSNGKQIDDQVATARSEKDPDSKNPNEELETPKLNSEPDKTQAGTDQEKKQSDDQMEVTKPESIADSTKSQDGSTTSRTVLSTKEIEFQNPAYTTSTNKNQMLSARNKPMQRQTKGNVSKSAAPKTRPYSAMDAYRYIVAHPIRLVDGGYNTSYQQQRTEAWKRNARNQNVEEEVVHNIPTPTGEEDEEGRHKSPPPQRPSSPAWRGHLSHSQPTSMKLHMKAGNEWLAGGRDLYFESYQKRPQSSHVPGWKEGLPESMKRPKSAIIPKSYRGKSRNSTPGPVTPSSIAYENMLHGYPSPNDSLPNLTDLSDYPPLFNQSQPRQLGTPPIGSDFYNPPLQDMVYRWS